MIQPYQDFQDRIKSVIHSGDWKFSSQILGVKLEEEQVKSERVEKHGV